jgi:putative oxygen-independent coproporphyrinogen III oxidase
MNNPGLYIHVPFCRTKCPYCDFYSMVDLSLIPAWLDALELEARIYRERFGFFDSLYLGGGTPTILGSRELTRLMGVLFRDLSFSEDPEITIEANPDDITKEKATLVRDLGFNRISLGVQSLHEKELRFLQRRHSAQQAEEAIERILVSGLTNLGIDLMYGLPGQGESEWMASLKRIVGYNPAHISCYQMTISEGTPFHRMIEQGRIQVPDEERERAFFLLTSAYLTENGYIHYEISNFAREERTMSRHNLKYWRHIPYLGLGPSAHSFIKGLRWWNLQSVNAYCQALACRKKPVEGRERLTDEQVRLESLFLGFRTNEGVKRSIIESCPGSDRALREIRSAGLVKLQADRIIPTREGFILADSLPLLFSHEPVPTPLNGTNRFPWEGGLP